jgi:phage terminase large subunit
MEINVDILPVFLDFFKSKKRTCLLLGGGGSGKSHAVAQKVILRVLNPYISDNLGSSEADHIISTNKDSCNFLIVRQTLSSHTDSTWSLIVKLIEEMGLTNLFYFNKSTKKIVCKTNNNFIVFKGLDNPEKLKSIDGISNIWVEEATECSKDAIDELYWRMRAKSNYNQMILTFNPISAKHWIKENLWDNNNPEIYKLKTTFNDNTKLPIHIKTSLLNEYKPGTYRHNVYILANWGSVKSNSSLYHSFDDIHIRHNIIDYSKPIHISLDFNVQPHSVCLIFQIDEENKEILLIDEVIEPYPATAEKLTKSFIEKYANWTNHIHVYGDSSAQNNTTASNKSNFNQVIDLLNDYYGEEWIIYRVASRNPDIIKSVAFLNHIFDGLYDYKLYIDTKCNETIDDLMNTKSDKNGSKLKEMGKTNDGVTYEKWSHCTDTIRYFISTCFVDGYSKFNTRGKSIEPMTEMRKSKLLGTTETQSINAPIFYPVGNRQSNF